MSIPLLKWKNRVKEKVINRLVIFLIGILAALILLFIVKGLDHRLQITRYELVSPKVSTEIKATFISDLHSCQYGENQSELIDNILAFQPDLILLGGDIVDDKLPESAGFQLIESAAKIAPTYFVAGNHEFYTLQCGRIKKQIADLGVVILAGTKASLEVKENTVNIIGIDDPIIGDKVYLPQLENLRDMKNPEFTFFLAHRPERIKDYQQVESDLVLAGHAHGGQWRIPGLLKGFIAPHQGLFPKFTAGFYDLQNTTLLVGRGLSRESTKIPRFYNRPELIELKIKPENES